MQYGSFYYPLPVNEPVLNYAKGSKEKLALKAALKEFKSIKIDVPMYIGADVRTGKTVTMHPPHEHKHVLGQYHVGDASHVKKAIAAALKAKDKSAAFKKMFARFSQLIPAHLSLAFKAVAIAFFT